MTLAAFAAATAIAGTVMQTQAQAQAAKTNAAIMERQATGAEQDAALAETQSRRQSKLLQGEANAIGAASGVSISSGSPLLMELDRVKQGELEALSIRRGGQFQAQGQRFGAQALRSTLPGIYAGGAAQGASILSTYVSRR